MPKFVDLSQGDLAPLFSARGGGLDKFLFDSIAGRYLVLCFYASTADPQGEAAIAAMMRNRNLFDDDHASFFGVCLDPSDEAQSKVRESMPGIRFFWDFDAAVSRLYGAVSEAVAGQPSHLRRFWIVVDPTLRILAKIPFDLLDPQHDAVFAFLNSQRHPSRYAGFEIPAPVLIIPHVFESALCQQLIGIYNTQGGGESGVMRMVDGRVQGVLDNSFKRRKDVTIEDPQLQLTLQKRIRDRVLPQIEQLFFMKMTRMERYIVGCYAAEDGGHFRPHRDNNTAITAHRRYAVSINLNGDFKGGEVSFPEYNRTGYKAPPGWAVIFPCAILHSVSRVTEGMRYAFLPFVYDESGRAIRDRNRAG
jgi:peroxiredoxin/predicted 2-oxoglutarate/Fe(II)-dependent dioxygenase YbiX